MADVAHDYFKGIKQGMPICLGYIPISFAFGMLAVQSGLPIFVPIAISVTNLTSAGQFAGLSVILAGGKYVELAITTFIINIRYMLMSLAISQRVDDKLSTPKRCAMSFGITDEVFAVAMQQNGTLSFSYMMGLITAPFFGWTVGTIIGATATSVLPVSVQTALGITIYAMFIAIIIPPAKTTRPITIVILIAVAISCVFKYTPILNALSTGWVIIIAAVIAAGYCAFRFPIDEDKQEETQ